jgi:hypothetical protein
MRFQKFGVRLPMLVATLAVLLALPSLAMAQDSGSGNNNNNNNNNNNGGGGNSSGSTTAQQAGVFIDAQGVFRTRTNIDPTGELTRQRMAAARAALNPNIRTFSKLRKVSLNRLEAALVAHQGVPNEEMKSLAGLLRVTNVFYYPETKDIVLAGPAEGWVEAPNGQVVGLTTARPIIQLQDLAAALRAFRPGGEPTPLIGCSIDPTQEGQASYQRFLQSAYPDLNNPAPFVIAMRNAMGNYTVRVDGVSPKTRMAQVMVEADYRMKLIGIGLERPPVRLASFIEKARPSEMSAHGLTRWFFTPDYQCVRVSEDKNAMELIGDGVKLVGENELVSSTGQRQVVGGAGPASKIFTTGFTRVYPQLAQRATVYADLRNMIDLLVSVAFIQHQDYYGLAGWNVPFLGNEKKFAIETFAVPKTVEAAVNAIKKGGTLMTPIAGGINIQATQAIEQNNLLRDENGKVGQLREKNQIHLAPGQWWWD